MASKIPASARTNQKLDELLTRGVAYGDARAELLRLAVRRTLAAVTDRFAAFEALDVHVDFPLSQRLALPIPCGQTKVPGIKIQDTRMIRLMEVLLHGGTTVRGWRTADIHQAILTSFGLSAERYTLTQVRYDLRKMWAHGLLERDSRRYAYQLTPKGIRVALSPTVCSSVGHQVRSQPPRSKPPTRRAQSIQRVVDLRAA